VSVRGRSFLAAFLGAGGVFLMLVAALLPGLTVLFWPGLGIFALGLVVLGFAMRDAVREIGNNQARFEASLRAEIGEKRDPKK